MRARRFLATMISIVAMTSIAVPAFGYQSEATNAMLAKLPQLWIYMPDRNDPATWTLPSPLPCETCHGVDSATTIGQPEGPHGTYLTTTRKCKECHTVHQGGLGILLLPDATLKGTCETCHDGTGGKGVYGVIKARTGLNPAAAHRVDTTNTIPGGDASTGGSRTATFGGTSGTMTCVDCHSPHGAKVVKAFTGDRQRSAEDPLGLNNIVVSSRLLKRLPTSAATATVDYGSDWCGGCHRGRLSGSGMANNHPVESSVNPPSTGGATGTFNYNYVAKLTGVGASTTTTGTMGHNNFGYVMPDPRTTGSTGQAGHRPICQQCHEDARHVGDVTAQTVVASEVFNVTALDGANATDSPRFQTFPHESDNPYFQVETYDDLCLNCHKPPA